MRSAAVTGEIDVDEVVDAVRAQPSMAGAALVAGVSTSEQYTFAAEGAVRVAVVDYGCKRSILRRLAANGAAVDVFPHDVDADTLAGYDGVLLSPGPGDPAPLDDETSEDRRAARPHAGARRLPRPPTARPRDRPGRRSSCRSAIAARTTRCSTTGRAGCSSRRRTTASPSPRATIRA